VSKVTQKKAKDGTVSHYLGRKLHRLDGPAQEMADGTKKYFISGLELTEKQFGVARDQGVTEFKKNSADPDYYWYKVGPEKYVEFWIGYSGNELLISTKKASSVNSVGTTGNFAKLNFNGDEEYYFETKTEYKYLNKEQWLQKMGANYLDPVKKEYSKVYGKGINDEKTVWYKDEACTIVHREGDLPAIEYKDGRQQYWLNGKQHRDGDLPAFISPSLTQWVLNGEYYLRPNDQPSDITPTSLSWYDRNNLKKRAVKNDLGWEVHYYEPRHTISLKGEEYRDKTYFEAMEIYKQKELLTHEWFGEKITKEEHEKRSKEWVTKIDSGATSRTIFYKDADKSVIAKISWVNGSNLYYTNGKPNNVYNPFVGNLRLVATADSKHYLTDASTANYTFQDSDIGCPAISFKQGDEKKEWQFNGVFQSFKGDVYHNSSGPAVIDVRGEQYYINGYEFDSKENWERVKSKYLILDFGTPFERTCFYQGAPFSKLISDPVIPSIFWASGAKAWANDKGEIVKMEIANSIYVLDTADGKLKNNGNWVLNPSSSNPIVVKDHSNYWRQCGNGLDGSSQYRSGIGITNKTDYDQYLKDYSTDASYKRFFYYDKEKTKIRRVQWDNAIAWLDFDINGEPVAIQLKDEVIGKNLQAVGKFLVDLESSKAYWRVSSASKWSDSSVDFGTREINKGEKISEDLYKSSAGYSKDPYGLILHRTDGPATQTSFYLDGVNYSLTDYNKKLKEMGLPPVGRVGSKKLAENSYEYNGSIFKDPECSILHCETGYAVTNSGYYYLDGVQYDYSNFVVKLRELGLPIVLKPGVIKIDEECYQYTNGSNITYYKEPELITKHRVDGPAETNGNEQSWYLNGKLHRDNGPAHQCNSCTQWRQNGNLHKTDGPAYIYHTTGEESYYLEGVKYSKEDWEAKLRPYRVKALNIGRRVAATQINQKLNHITPHPISKNILAYVLGTATLKSNRSEVRKLGTEIRVDALANLGGNFLDQLGRELKATLGAKPLGFEIPEDLGKEAESLKEEIVIENLQELKR